MPDAAPVSSATILAWHFVADALRDGRPVPPDGVKLLHGATPILCESGLHASERLIDALQYAPGNTICRVKCGGHIVTGADKIVCTERTILWRIDATVLLRAFARKCALDVAHLWDMPKVVRDYLDSGDESLRAAARDAAGGARAAAAWAAAGGARAAAARAAQNVRLVAMVEAAR